jgi:hypothetical protein
VLLLAAVGTAWGCGFENPHSAASQRGMMNLAFPQSAWVRTAIWQAQLAGDLPRDEAAPRDELTSQALGVLQRIRTAWLLKTLVGRLGTGADLAGRPAVAVVLMGPMLWSRIEPQAGPGSGGAQALVHVSGPAPGDVVLVTDTPALEAIVGAGMAFDRALALGLVRLYGSQTEVGAAQAWLSGAR